jgi:hypothetical protein
VSTYAPRPLQAGQSVRLREDGPVVKVVRVTPCAAYVASPRTRPHPDPERAAAGERITAHVVEPISRNAFVFTVDEQ